MAVLYVQVKHIFILESGLDPSKLKKGLLDFRILLKGNHNVTNAIKLGIYVKN